MSKYDVDQFDPAPDPDLVCPICQCVLHQPMECPCRHVFCQICIETWLSKNSTCPTCREHATKDDMRPVLPIISNMINRLPMRCANEDTGCVERILLEKYEAHISGCGFKLELCQYPLCGEMILRKDIKDHEESCECRTVKCEGRCQLMIAMKDLERHNCLDSLVKLVKDQGNELERLRKREQELQDLKTQLQDQLADVNRRYEEARNADLDNINIDLNLDGGDDDSNMTGSTWNSYVSEYTVNSDIEDADEGDFDDDWGMVTEEEEEAGYITSDNELDTRSLTDHTHPQGSSHSDHEDGGDHGYNMPWPPPENASLRVVLNQSLISPSPDNDEARDAPASCADERDSYDEGSVTPTYSHSGSDMSADHGGSDQSMDTSHSTGSNVAYNTDDSQSEDRRIVTDSSRRISSSDDISDQSEHSENNDDENNRDDDDNACDGQFDQNDLNVTNERNYESNGDHDNDLDHSQHSHVSEDHSLTSYHSSDQQSDDNGQTSDHQDGEDHDSMHENTQNEEIVELNDVVDDEFSREMNENECDDPSDSNEDKDDKDNVSDAENDNELSESERSEVSSRKGDIWSEESYLDGDYSNISHHEDDSHDEERNDSDVSDSGNESPSSNKGQSRFENKLSSKYREKDNSTCSSSAQDSSINSQDSSISSSNNSNLSHSSHRSSSADSEDSFSIEEDSNSQLELLEDTLYLAKTAVKDESKEQSRKRKTAASDSDSSTLARKRRRQEVSGNVRLVPSAAGSAETANIAYQEVGQRSRSSRNSNGRLRVSINVNLDVGRNGRSRERRTENSVGDTRIVTIEKTADEKSHDRSRLKLHTRQEALLGNPTTLQQNVKVSSSSSSSRKRRNVIKSSRNKDTASRPVARDQDQRLGTSEGDQNGNVRYSYRTNPMMNLTEDDISLNHHNKVDSSSSSDDEWVPLKEESDITISEDEDHHDLEPESDYEVQVPKTTIELLEEYDSGDSDDSWSKC